MDTGSTPSHATRPNLGQRMLRHLKVAAIVYPSLFVATMLLAMAASYVWPWLLDPVTP